MAFLETLFGVLPSAVGAIGSLFSNGMNAKSVQSANQANIDLARENREYYSPSNVKQMYQQAGLNPDLLYGSGASMPTIQTPSQMPNQYDFSGLRPSSQDVLALAQADKIRSETENQNIRNIFQASHEQLALQLERNSLGLQIDTHNLNDAELRSMALNMDLIESNISKNSAEISEIWSRVNNLNEETKSKVIQNFLDSNTVDLKIRQLNKELDLTDAQIKSVIQDTLLGRAKTDLTKQEKALSVATMLLTDTNRKRVDFDLKIDSEDTALGVSSKRFEKIVSMATSILGSFTGSMFHLSNIK